jgi:hypothetical protein
LIFPPWALRKMNGKKKKRCVYCCLTVCPEVWREGYYQTKYNTPSNKHTVSKSVSPQLRKLREREREREREWPASCYIVVSIITRNRNRTAGRSVFWAVDDGQLFLPTQHGRLWNRRKRITHKKGKIKEKNKNNIHNQKTCCYIISIGFPTWLSRAAAWKHQLNTERW